MDLWPTFGDDYAALYRFAHRMGCDRDAAEDMVQEAMLRLARSGSSDLDGDARRRWLFVVVRNLCLSRHRSRSRHPEVDLEDAPAARSREPGPAEAAAGAERRRIVARAVAALPPDQREVIVLREYEGMDYARIAEVTGAQVGTVRSRLARARAALCEMLAPIVEEER